MITYTEARKIGQSETYRQNVPVTDLYEALDIIVDDERFTESQVNLYQSRICDELVRRGY